MTAKTPDDPKPVARIERFGVTTILWPDTRDTHRQINVLNDRGVLIFTESQATELMTQLAYHLHRTVT